jgi:hypothetical protein
MNPGPDVNNTKILENMNKIQVKEMKEKMVDENGRVVMKDGKPVMITIGTLYVESTAGRIQEILDEHGDAFVASLLDQQILHHQASAAFKSKASKTDSKVGLEKLKSMPHSANQLYKSSKVEAEKEGFDVSAVPDSAEVVMVNWSFQPGTSQAAVAKEAAIEKAVAMQLELLSGVQEITEEVKAKVEAFVRSRM